MASPISPTNRADVVSVTNTGFSFDEKAMVEVAATANVVAQYKFTVDFHDQGAKTSTAPDLQGRVVHIAAGSLGEALKVLQAYAQEVRSSNGKVLDDKTCRHVFFSKPDSKGNYTASLYKGAVEVAKVTIDKNLQGHAKHIDTRYEAWKKVYPDQAQSKTTADITVTPSTTDPTSVGLTLVPEGFKDFTEAKMPKYPGPLTDTTGYSATPIGFPTPITNDPTNKHEPSIINITIPDAPGGFNFQIRRESIFDSKAQVIVNDANTQLTGGGGIDGAIHTKGGVAYAGHHTVLSNNYNKSYPEGYATIVPFTDSTTQGSTTNVIIVAGPNAQDGYDSKLYNCYRNSLELAHKQRKTSIAFPAISTGIFDGDMNKSAEISLRAVSDFITANPKTQLKTISIHGYPVNDTDSSGKRSAGAERDDALIPAYEAAVRKASTT